MNAKPATATKERQAAPPPRGATATKPRPAAPQVKKQPAAKLPAVVSNKNPRAAVTTLGGTIGVLAEIARDKDLKPEKAEAVLKMQMAIMAEESRRAFNSAFIEMQKELPEIGTDGRIEIREKVGGQRTGKVQQSTPYATYPNLMKICKPILAKYGFGLSHATEPSADNSRIIVRGILDHVGGHSRSSAFPVPIEESGSKNNVQGWGSSQSYGRRYTSIALLNLVTRAKEDRDLDGNKPEDVAQPGEGDEAKVSADQLKKLKAAIEFCGVDETKVLVKYQIEDFADLPARLFQTVMTACQRFKEATAAAQSKKGG